MLFSKIHHLRHFGFGYFKSINAAHANAIAVDMQHDALGIITRFVEEQLQHHNNKFLRREIIVQQQNLIHGRFLRLRSGLGQHASIGIV